MNRRMWAEPAAPGGLVAASTVVTGVGAAHFRHDPIDPFSNGNIEINPDVLAGRLSCRGEAGHNDRDRVGGAGPPSMGYYKEWLGIQRLASNMDGLATVGHSWDDDLGQRFGDACKGCADRDGIKDKHGAVPWSLENKGSHGPPDGVWSKESGSVTGCMMLPTLGTAVLAVPAILATRRWNA